MELVADPLGLGDRIDEDAAFFLADHGFDVDAGDALKPIGKRGHIGEVVAGPVGWGIAEVGIGALGEIPKVEVGIAEGYRIGHYR